MSADDELIPPAIDVVEVTKAYGAQRAVEAASLRARHGETVAILGPSGSGKTTLLRIIAGFEEPDSGTVAIAGVPVAGGGRWVEPECRRVGMVFQQGALFPHLNVEANVRFGARTDARARECLELVGLRKRAKAYPHELSGGERQRIALARALAHDPEVVLLDEPFAALDAGLRETLREEVARILFEAGTTSVLVTHDQAEALSLADTVVVLRDGCVEQQGTPAEIYARPASRWVAEFLGDANILPAQVVDGGKVVCELGRWDSNGTPPGAVEVVVRPEAVSVSAFGTCPATVESRSFYGPHEVIRLRLPSGATVRCRQPGAGPWRAGDEVRLAVAGDVSVVPASNGAHGATAR